MREIEEGKKYRHFKGNMYKVLGIAYDAVASTNDKLKKVVIYQALYGDELVWVRPYENFASEVNHEKYPDISQKYRFEKCE